MLLLEERLDRRQQRGDGHAGQDDRHRRPLSTHRRPHHVGERDRTHRAGEGSQGQELGESLRPRHDDRGGPEPRSRRHAQEVRIGQGIAEHSLERGSASGQHGPHQAAEHDPREPDLPQDVGVDATDARMEVQQRDVRQQHAHAPR